MLFYEPDQRDRDLLPHDPFKAMVGPRPIGWMSTLGPAGELNLAPYSFFNGVCDAPPMVMFSSNGLKDTVTFAGARGEFVWNMATWNLRIAMNESSASVPRGVDEFQLAGLETARSRIVAAPRVAASPCSLECRVVEVFALNDLEGTPVGWHLVVGQVVGVHIDERYIVDGRLDAVAMQPISRSGYNGDYTVLEHLFEMLRPSVGS